jgi:hypothetical protein
MQFHCKECLSDPIERQKGDISIRSETSNF